MTRSISLGCVSRFSPDLAGLPSPVLVRYDAALHKSPSALSQQMPVAMIQDRPVFLDLWRIRLPISGLVSILHRISGVLMVFAIPVFTLLFGLALEGPEGFALAATMTTHPLGKLGLLTLGWAMLHHFLSGLRYLVIDLGIGVDRPIARKTAWGVLSAGLALTVVGGGVLL